MKKWKNNSQSVAWQRNMVSRTSVIIRPYMAYRLFGIDVIVSWTHRKKHYGTFK